MENSPDVIRNARELNPDVRVLARAAYLRDLNPLHHAGADNVYSGEGEVALAFIEDIMGHLGATAEQIGARPGARGVVWGLTPLGSLDRWKLILTV